LEQIRWVQDTVFATWLRESSWALFAGLILHTLAMGFLVGAGLAVNARNLGVARSIPIEALRRLWPVMATAIAAAIFSGVLLVLAYPAKALTNPLFYVKLAILTAAILITRRLLRTPSARLAALTIPLWFAGVTLGRFLAYTHKMLLVY
jgi:hypothetical protein